MAIVLLLPASGWAGDELKGKQVLGWLEAGLVYPGGARVIMKLDSGAKTSSIHAEDIEVFEKKDKKWVRFRFDTTYDDDEDQRYDISIERPMVREVVIKRHKKKSQSRPVVNLEICIAGKRHKGEFSLVDRSRFNYPVLLGRRLLSDLTVIDPAETFTSEPDCKEQSG